MATLGASTSALCITIAIVACLGVVRTRQALSRESELTRQAVTAQRRAVIEQQRAAANLQLALSAFDELAHVLDLGQGPTATSLTLQDEVEPEFLPTVSDDTARLLTELSAQHPEVPEYRYELSEVYARVHLWRPGPRQSNETDASELKQAERRLRKALALGRDLTLKYPSVPDYAAALGRNLCKMGLVMQRRGELEAAEQFYRRAATKLEMLTKRFEKIPAYRDALADATHAWGRLLCHQSRFAEAETLLQQSIESRRAFLSVMPNHRRSRGILVEQYHDLSITLKALGQDARAAELAVSSDRLRDSLWPNGAAGR